MTTIKVTLTGDGSALLVHSDRVANPFDDLTREMKTLTSKRKKTDDDLTAIMRIEFEGGLYFSETEGPFIPTWNIKKSFIEGGRINKLGKHVERAFNAMQHTAPLVYEGPRTIQSLWDKGFYDVRLVKIGTARTLRCRPRFWMWSLEFIADLDMNIINLAEFAQVASNAGRMIGLGDFRSRYGRYTVEIR